MNLDPLTLGDCLASLILIISAIINWKIFMLYYKGRVKPKGRYYFVAGLVIFALLHEGIEVFISLIGFGVKFVIMDQWVYMGYVILKAIGPVIIFYASLLMYNEAKRFGVA